MGGGGGGGEVEKSEFGLGGGLVANEYWEGVEGREGYHSKHTSGGGLGWGGEARGGGEVATSKLWFGGRLLANEYWEGVEGREGIP